MAIDDDFERDAIEGLVEYVEEVKPYHSKIVEVLIEYIYTDELSVSIADNFSSVLNVTVNDFRSGCADGYDTGGYDIYAGNIEPEYVIGGIDQGDNTVTISSTDATINYPTGKVTLISDSTGNDGNYIVDYSIFDGNDTIIYIASPSLPSATADGNITSYIEDSGNFPLSNYDLSIDPSCDIEALGSPVGGKMATTFNEELIIELVPIDLLGAEYDVSGFDEFDGGGFDI